CLDTGANAAARVGLRGPNRIEDFDNVGSGDFINRQVPNVRQDICREALPPLVSGAVTTPVRSLRSDIRLSHRAERHRLSIGGLPLAAPLGNNVNLVATDLRPKLISELARGCEADGGGRT